MIQTGRHAAPRPVNSRPAAPWQSPPPPPRDARARFNSSLTAMAGTPIYDRLATEWAKQAAQADARTPAEPPPPADGEADAPTDAPGPAEPDAT